MTGRTGTPARVRAWGQRTVWVLVAACVAGTASGQSIAGRGFVDGRGMLFAQVAPNDSQRVVGDLLARAELFGRVTDWLQLAGGIDLRANTHDQVERTLRVDLRDRGVRRPVLGLRRATATVTRGPVAVDVGRQFIRWGKADIVTPTDHMAPRDFLNVIDGEFLGVTGARLTAQHGTMSIDVAWLPTFTPSRVPLLDQRWAVAAEGAVPLTLNDGGAVFPSRGQLGVRWGRVAAGHEYSASFFDGYNHLPNVDIRPTAVPTAFEVVRSYPALRSYGVDAAVPTSWFTLKGEAAYSTSTTPGTDEYVLYVIQAERQTGEWSLIGGYAGEVVTRRRAERTFAPDRGLTRSVVARASYTIDTNRSVAFETAIRQSGDGAYAKAEYSQSRGAHWRATLSGVLIGGRADDFLGQYRKNSHGVLSLRYSF